MHDSRDLLRLQERPLLQSKTDRKQVKLLVAARSSHFVHPIMFIPETKVDSLLSPSYKVPAKGDGVDYVRTEDEVSTSKISEVTCVE